MNSNANQFWFIAKKIQNTGRAPRKSSTAYPFIGSRSRISFLAAARLHGWDVFRASGEKEFLLTRYAMFFRLNRFYSTSSQAFHTIFFLPSLNLNYSEFWIFNLQKNVNSLHRIFIFRSLDMDFPFVCIRDLGIRDLERLSLVFK